MDRSLALRLSRPAAIPVPRMPRRPLLALCIALLTLALLGGGWLWLRNSALVAVERVEVTGAVGTEGYAVRAALEEAALHMSTLDVNVGALRAAVAPLHVVSGLKVSTGFPHTLRIEVIERAPVAVLTVGGMKTAAAADGTLLGPALLRHGLPVVQGNGSEALGSGQVSNPNTREALAVLGAAPPALVGWVARVYNGAEGLTVAMRNGLLIYFGDATRAHAKWLSAARVLADTSSQGASYVDVRLPGRPAAGFPGGVANGSEAAATTAGRVSATDPTAASLAASLEQAIGSSTGTGSATSAASTTEAAAPATTSPTEAATPTPTSTSGAASAPRSPAEATAPATRSPGEAATSVPQSEPSSSTGG